MGVSPLNCDLAPCKNSYCSSPSKIQSMETDFMGKGCVSVRDVEGLVLTFGWLLLTTAILVLLHI